MSKTTTDTPEGRSAVAEPAMRAAHPAQPSPGGGRIPASLQAPPVLAAFAAALGVLYVVFNFLPLWHTDVWGHAAYGRWIARTGHVPVTEPLMPLARGMPFVDTAWLSQWLAFQAESRWGPPVLQAMYAALVTATFGLLAAALYRRTGSTAAAVFGALTFGALNWQPLMVQRPQAAGLLCFTLLFCWLSSPRRPAWLYFAVPALFAVWANLHGSFPIGLLLIAAYAAGSAIDLGLRGAGDVFTRPARDRHRRRPADALAPAAIFSTSSPAPSPLTPLAPPDPASNRTTALLRLRPVWLLMLLELAAAAALLNPYGIGVYVETFTFSRNLNLADLVEWDPLTFRMRHGQAAAAAVLALAVVYRLSPRRVRAAELLVLAGLGALALWHSRMLVWWSVPAAYYLGLHAAAVATRWPAADAPPARRSMKWSAAAVVLAWLSFAATPFAIALLHGPPRDEEQALQRLRRSVSEQTPVDAVAYLRAKRPPGPVFNTYEWGDYLLWAGPSDVEVFVNSHAHLVPAEVWVDYMRIAHARDGWEFGLDRYGINTVLLDHRGREPLISALRRNDRWEVAYEDAIAVVFVRKIPIAVARAASDPPVAGAARRSSELPAGLGAAPPDRTESAS